MVQALLAFLACRSAGDVAAVWTEGAGRPGWLGRLGVAWLCAFAPVLAWRLGHGHLNLVVGLLPFAAGLALVAAAAARTVSVVLVVLTTAALGLGLLHSGQQIVVAGALFGAPVLVGAWISLGGGWRGVAVPALVAIGALLVTLPWFWVMLAHARSSDAARPLGGTTVTYDFIVATNRDWLTSIPWTTAALPSARDASLHHEVNYPAGPLLVLLAAAPWRRARALALGLAVSLAGVLVVSLDLAPVSRALLDLLPPLKSFRVPARAVLPWVWAVAVVASAAILHRGALVSTPAAAPRPSRRRRRRAAKTAPAPRGWWRPYAVLLALPLACVFWLAPSVAREVAAWTLAGAGVVLLRRRWEPALTAVVLVLVLGAGSVAAFRERLLPFPDAAALLAEAGRLGDTVRRARPELASPLTRVRLELAVPAFATNTAFAAGLSSLDGYGVPTRRFAALVFALRGHRLESTAVFFNLPPADRAFPVLRQLYDVAWQVTVPARGRLSLEPLGPTAGPAWFSASVARVSDPTALARVLTSESAALHQRATAVLWLDDADPLTGRAALPATLDGRCREARVSSVEAARRGREVVVRTETAAACPLTLAMNFTEDLRATARLADGRSVTAPVFPGYGALASVSVPAGTVQVRVHAEAPRLPGAAAWVALGLACCGGAAWLARRDRATLC